MDKYLMVVIGGGLGALARFALGVEITERFGWRFPLATLVINVSGSFLVGLLMTLLTQRLHVHQNWRFLLVVGVLGGYTTFSTFEYETFQAFQAGSRLIGLANAIGSVVLGYIAVWIGARIIQ